MLNSLSAMIIICGFVNLHVFLCFLLARLSFIFLLFYALIFVYLLPFLPPSFRPFLRLSFFSFSLFPFPCSFTFWTHYGLILLRTIIMFVRQQYCILRLMFTDVETKISCCETDYCNNARSWFLNPVFLLLPVLVCLFQYQNIQCIVAQVSLVVLICSNCR